ncbi:hypothetical protein OPT61_g5147 [Boeremia exigua]|uniref:Uncharacterized protein n=1 Tax=Boeremia exigua TaxID=749465 RepID=A0ACC2IBH2_9PLEO|nr:hypothetical protein OPT61_g5147 [Boeremia exigua]
MADRFKDIVPEYLSDPEYFNFFFRFDTKLGSGCDGEVTGYFHIPTGRTIAVKTPRPNDFVAYQIIQREAKVLAHIGKSRTQENIAHMLAYQPEFGKTRCPAMFSECADFGDLLEYRHAWQEQQAACEEPWGIAEATVWKLFKDMALALDFLHNECGFVHRDVKPGNILVTCPPNERSEWVPTVPLFKLCDFSRAVEYPAPDGKIHHWAGTLTYAPPPCERHSSEPARPAGDMWSLGATLQEFALGVGPSRSRKSMICSLLLENMPIPDNEIMWSLPEYEFVFWAQYRPLNLSAFALNLYDLDELVPECYEPFSNMLEHWYKKLFTINDTQRVTSAELVRDMVPRVDKYIVAANDNAEEKDGADGVPTRRSVALSTPAPTRTVIEGGDCFVALAKAPSYKDRT